MIATATVSGLTWVAYAGVTVGALQLAWQVRSVDFDDPESCLAMFKSNHFFAALVFTGFLVS